MADVFLCRVCIVQKDLMAGLAMLLKEAVDSVWKSSSGSKKAQNCLQILNPKNKRQSRLTPQDADKAVGHAVRVGN
jgi:hypothetical protein